MVYFCYLLRQSNKHVRSDTIAQILLQGKLFTLEVRRGGMLARLNCNRSMPVRCEFELHQRLQMLRLEQETTIIA